MTGNKFIICGASRSGKSRLAKRMQEKLGISWIVGDALVSSLEDAFPELGISHHGDFHAIADKFETYIKYMLWNYDYEGCGYVFDATHLYPRNVVSMRKKIGDVPAVFLGYANADAEKKFLDIRRFDPGENFWTAEQSDEELMTHVRDQIKKSRDVEAACKEYDIPYIDTSGDFEAALDEAERLLLSY